MKRIQTAELKASAAEREVQLLRISLQQQKEKVEQVHELLMLREQEHRYMFPNNPAKICSIVEYVRNSSF